MPKYLVEIAATMRRDVVVIANSKDEALGTAEMDFEFWVANHSTLWKYIDTVLAGDKATEVSDELHARLLKFKKVIDIPHIEMED